MKTMILLLAIASLTSCTTAHLTPETRTVHGVLTFYPGNVKSVQAWYGHRFMVGGTPILATDEVPEDVLMNLAGKLVTVQGVWQPGKRWRPAAKEKNTQMPVDPDREIFIVGDGLRALRIVLEEK